MSFRTRLAKLDAHTPPEDGGRLFFLLPDLWHDKDRTAFETLHGDALADLVEGRTGVRPILGTGRIWAIVTPGPDDVRATSAAEQAAYFDGQETRPWLPWER